MESRRVRERGSEIVAEECAGNCHSCYLLVMSDKYQSKPRCIARIRGDVVGNIVRRKRGKKARVMV